MKKIKYIGMIAIASSTLLFSGCVADRENSFPIQNSYQNNIYDHNIRREESNFSLLSYSYPYYFDRPFYYVDGRYYYGGIFRDGFYHYGNRKFRHGHYYSRGYRYYNGRRYRAINRQHGYFRNRDSYRHSDYYRNRDRNKVKRVNRGRKYRANKYNSRGGYYNNSWDNTIKRKLNYTTKKHLSKHVNKSTVRERPSR